MARTHDDDLNVSFLLQGAQTAEDVAFWYAAFIAGASRTLDLAFYDFRLSPSIERIITEALAERAAAGVRIRIVYDADKPAQPATAVGIDPASPGTGAHVQALGYPFQRIGGLELMHNKYTVRDAGSSCATVWTGSTNFTDDAFTLQDNNIVRIQSPEIAADYSRDFEELWEKRKMDGTGKFVTTYVDSLYYKGQRLRARAMFSPGCGHEIDGEIAARVASAKYRVRVCSMLLNSGTLLQSLLELLDRGKVHVDGVYDKTQMEGVLRQWQDVPHNHWKIPAVREIVERAGLTGKLSRPYRPNAPHDFMHNKVLVVDDLVITGSFNFSRSAERNSENVLLLENAPVADLYSDYVDRLKARIEREISLHATPVRNLH
ncbi:MAG: phospholipase D-like domain-containing protein [Capsulimonadaceae bacterium]|nr:phospholipase D-like domain-containing protein [Capsulimonadaceae bacterium]